MIAARGARLRLFLWGWLGLGMGVVGCQLVFDGAIEAVRCAEEGALGPPACPANLLCQDGLCTPVVAGHLLLGETCGRSRDCTEGLFCLDPKDFGGEGPPVCSRPCCSSSDCGEPTESFVCWTPDLGGGSFCRSTISIGRASAGALEVGKLCSVDTGCRSALCSNGRCVDGCCADNDCVPAGGTCLLRANVISSGIHWACAATPYGKNELLEPCAADVDCTSNLCVEIRGEKRCSRPCCKSDECPDHAVEGIPGFLACADVLHQGSSVRACSRWVPEPATGTVGAECSEEAACRSGRCVPGLSGAICTDVCCTDASCGDLSRFVCRPDPPSGNHGLRCEPK